MSNSYGDPADHERSSLVVIEILSPTDKMGETLARFRDYARLGASHIIQLDPENYVTHRFESGSLLETHFSELSFQHSPVERFQKQRSIPFVSDALFEQLRMEVAEAGA